MKFKRGRIFSLYFYWIVLIREGWKGLKSFTVRRRYLHGGSDPGQMRNSWVQLGVRWREGGRSVFCVMGSEKCCGCLPAYGVCRINFMTQFCVYVRKLNYSHLLAKMLCIKVHTSSTIMYVVNKSITILYWVPSQFYRVDAGFTIFC